MVRLAWLHQGLYGKMTHIAQEYPLSRTWLYQLIWAANRPWEPLFSEQKPCVANPSPLLDPCIFLVRVEGKCSLPSLSSILQYCPYQPHSVRYRSACVHTDGAARPSTLPMAEHTVVLSRSEEMFARHQPLVVTIEAQRTAIVTIPLASERSAETWHAHFDDLAAHRFP